MRGRDGDAERGACESWTVDIANGDRDALMRTRSNSTDPHRGPDRWKTRYLSPIRSMASNAKNTRRTWRDVTAPSKIRARASFKINKLRAITGTRSTPSAIRRARVKGEWMGPVLGVGTTKLCIGNEDAGVPRGRARSAKCEDTARGCRSRLARLFLDDRAHRHGSIGGIGGARRRTEEARACGSNVGGRKIAKQSGRRQPTCFRRFSADCFHLPAACIYVPAPS